MAPAPQRAAPQQAAAPQRAPVPAAAPPSAMASPAAQGPSKLNQLFGQLGWLFFVITFRHDGWNRSDSRWCCPRKRCRTRNHWNVLRRIIIVGRTSTSTTSACRPTVTISILTARTTNTGCMRMGDQAIPAVRSATVWSYTLRRLQWSNPTVQIGWSILRWTLRYSRPSLAIFVSDAFLIFHLPSCPPLSWVLPGSLFAQAVSPHLVSSIAKSRSCERTLSFSYHFRPSSDDDKLLT